MTASTRPSGDAADGSGTAKAEIQDRLPSDRTDTSDVKAPGAVPLDDLQRALAQKVHIYHAVDMSVEDIAGITDLDPAVVREFLKTPAPRSPRLRGGLPLGQGR